MSKTMKMDAIAHDPSPNMARPSIGMANGSQIIFYGLDVDISGDLDGVIYLTPRERAPLQREINDGRRAVLETLCAPTQARDHQIMLDGEEEDFPDSDGES